MSGPRVAFVGNDRWSVPALRAVAASEALELAVVLTRVPRPAGRGNRLRATPVADSAREGGLPLVEVETVREGVGFETLQAAGPDVLAVVAYGEILPPGVLALPRVGAVNLHFSLLPAFRGASPVQHALLAGLEVTGVTTMLMDAGMDTGPILQQATEPIRPEDDAGSLGDRLARVGADLLVGTIRDLAAGGIEATPQDDARATLAPKIRPDDRPLVWSEPAERLVRRVRALAPEPAATTRYRGSPIKVLRAEATADRGAPGTVLSVDDGILVAAGEGALRLLEVAPAGRRRMSGAAFVRGHRPEPGERFG